MAKSVRGINRDFSEARRTRKEKWKWDWEGGESLEEDAEKDKKNQDIIGKLTGSASLGQGNASSSAGSSSRRFYLPGSSTFATQSDRRSLTPTTSKRPQEEVQDREIKKVKTEEAPLGVYDPYTGQVHYPRSLQSERARFEKVSPFSQRQKRSDSGSFLTASPFDLTGLCKSSNRLCRWFIYFFFFERSDSWWSSSRTRSLGSG